MFRECIEESIKIIINIIIFWTWNRSKFRPSWFHEYSKAFLHYKYLRIFIEALQILKIHD